MNPEQFTLPLDGSTARAPRPLTEKQLAALGRVLATPQWQSVLGRHLVYRLRSRGLVETTRSPSHYPHLRVVTITNKGKAALQA